MGFPAFVVSTMGAAPLPRENGAGKRTVIEGGPMSRFQQRRGRITRVGVVLTAAVVLAGCTPTGGDPDPIPTLSVTIDPTPTPPPTQSPSVDPAVAEAEAAVLAAYEGFWAAKVAYLAAPGEPEPPELQQYAVDKALAGLREAAELFALNGIVTQGAPDISPEVTQLELEGMPSAVIVDCVDTTNWQPIYSATGESAAAPGQNARQPTESYTFLYDGRWVIGDTTIYRDRTC